MKKLGGEAPALPEIFISAKGQYAATTAAAGA
jgi:hypothetical protein